MPSLVRYGSDTGVADEQLRKRLLEIPLGLFGIRNWTEPTYESCEHDEANQATAGSRGEARFLLFVTTVIDVKGSDL